MKYQNVKAFEKHLTSAAPNHLCRLYLVAIPDDFERAKAIDAILGYLSDQPLRFRASDFDLRELLDALSSMSLLGESIVVLDEVEKMAKKEAEALIDHLPKIAGTAIFGSRSKTALMAPVEKEGVVLDLLEEKIWDKEKRLESGLVERAKKAGKRLNPDCAPLLIERLGTDAAVLDSEIDKLICFVGDLGQITSEDVLKISPQNRISSFWQAAEEVVWEGGGFPPVDAGNFQPLLLAVRSQLHLGLTLATLIEEKRSSNEWGEFLPKLWPKTLEKRSSQAARLGSGYFQKGLEKLFDIELLSRMNSTQFQALLDLFRVQIHAR